MEDINRRFSKDAAWAAKKRSGEKDDPEISDVPEDQDPILLRRDWVITPPVTELPEPRTLSMKDIKERDEASMKERKARLAQTLHTHPRYGEPTQRIDPESLRTPLISEKVSRRLAIIGSIATTATIIVGASWGINEILKRDYSGPDPKLAAPVSPVPFENQTVAQKIDAATTKAEQATLTQEERVSIAKQWFKEGEDLSRAAVDTRTRGQYSLMHHTTLGARVAQLKEEGNVFQNITGEAFNLALPGSPEYRMIQSDHLIRGSAIVRLGIMSMDPSIKPDTDLEGHVPAIFIPHVHALGDLVKFDGAEARIYDQKHKFEEYPYLYRQIAAMHNAGKEYPKELYVSDYTGINVASKFASMDAAHPTHVVPVYAGPANPNWVNDFRKVAYVDPGIKGAYFRGIDFTDPNRDSEFRFMNDLNTFFDNGQGMRRSLLGMLGCSAFAYAGQRYTELYNVLHQGLGIEFTLNVQQRLFNETYAPGMMVAVEDAYTDHPNQEVRLFLTPSYEIPDKFEIRLPNRELVLLAGEPLFMRDPQSLRAVNQWPVRAGRGRFIQRPDGTVIEDRSVKEYKGYWQEDWLGKIAQKP